MRILIADDDAISRRFLESTLNRLGHEVIAVADGCAALEALLDPAGPRIAILDWMMPGMDGLDVCRAVRERASPYVYTILLTSRDRREDMVAALDAGADDFLTKPFDAVELRARLRSGERVVELQETLLAAQERLRQAASRDHLTGLWNRGMILELLARELRRAEREHGALAVAMADVDHFKPINDELGHRAGDEVLRQLAQRMQEALRPYDFLGRYGGEEFLIVLPGVEGQAALQSVERVREVIADRPFRVDDTVLTVTASFGVASTRGAAEASALIDAADAAMYSAKAAGRNRVMLAGAQQQPVRQGMKD